MKFSRKKNVDLKSPPLFGKKYACFDAMRPVYRMIAERDLDEFDSAGRNTLT
jgi:hypothetical protein